jgi:type II secretory pathway component PulL
MADTLFSLDIHSDVLAAVVVDRSSRINLVTGCATTEVTDETFAAAVDRIKEQTGFVGGSCIVTCGAEFFSFRNITLPFTERKKIEQVLLFELDDLLPTGTKSLLVDFTVTKKGPQSANILAALINREYLAEKLAVLHSRGINPDQIGISGLATAMKIAENHEADTFVLIDIGTHWATVFVVLDKQIALIRSLGIPRQDKADSGIDDTLVLRVKQTLLASRLVDLATPSYRVYLAGMVQGWTDFTVLSESLGGVEINTYLQSAQPFIKIDPEIHRRYLPEVMDRVLAPAVKGIAKSAGFNFRKDEFKKRKSLREHRRLLLMVGAPLLVVFMAVSVYWAYDYRHLLAQQEQLRSQIFDVFRETLPGVERIVNPVHQLQVVNNQIRATYKPGGENGSGYTIIDLLAALSVRIPVSYKVKVVRLVADADTVRIKAMTGDFNTVDNVQKELEKSRFFKDVIITSANQSSQGDEVSFELKLGLGRK